MKKCIITCFIWIFCSFQAFGEPPLKAILIVAQAAYAAAQIGMTKVAAPIFTIIHMGTVFMPDGAPSGGGGSPRERRERRERAQFAEATKREQEREASNRRRLAEQRSRNGGLTDEEVGWKLQAQKAESEKQQIAKEEAEKELKEAALKAGQKNANRMQKEVERKQGPKGIIRIDKGDEKYGEIPHVHFDDGTSLNCDGSVHNKKNGVPQPTNWQAKWLLEWGWRVPGFALKRAGLTTEPGVLYLTPSSHEEEDDKYDVYDVRF